MDGSLFCLDRPVDRTVEQPSVPKSPSPDGAPDLTTAVAELRQELSRQAATIEQQARALEELKGEKERPEMAHTPGLHAWCIIKATSRSTGLRDGAIGTAALVLSLGLLLLQGAVTYSMSIEAAHPRCSDHADCRLGEFCGPTAALHESHVSYGWCENCSHRHLVVTSYLLRRTILM